MVSQVATLWGSWSPSHKSEIQNVILDHSRIFYLPFTLGPFDPIANLNMIIHRMRYKNSSFILSTIHSLEVSRIHNSALNSASIDCSKGYISFVRTLVSYLFVFKFSFFCSLYGVSASVCCSPFVSKLSDSQSVYFNQLKESKPYLLHQFYILKSFRQASFKQTLKPTIISYTALSGPFGRNHLFCLKKKYS